MELSNGMPSTTKSGCVLPVKEENPLMLILVDCPGAPPDPVILTPATLPDNALKGSDSDRWTSASDEMSVTAYPRAFLSLLIPKAVTTTSSSNCPSTITTLISSFPDTSILWLSKPV